MALVESQSMLISPPQLAGCLIHLPRACLVGHVDMAIRGIIDVLSHFALLNSDDIDKWLLCCSSEVSMNVNTFHCCIFVTVRSNASDIKLRLLFNTTCCSSAQHVAGQHVAVALV